MANLIKDSNNKWSGQITLTNQNSTISLPTEGKYVDKDIDLNINIQDAIFVRSEQLNTDWEELVNLYEVSRAGFAKEGQQGIFYIPWYDFDGINTEDSRFTIQQIIDGDNCELRITD